MALALGRRQQAEQDLDERALAGPVGADEADDALADLDAQPVERGDAAGIALREGLGADEGAGMRRLSLPARSRPRATCSGRGPGRGTSRGCSSKFELAAAAAEVVGLRRRARSSRPWAVAISRLTSMPHTGSVAGGVVRGSFIGSPSVSYRVWSGGARSARSRRELATTLTLESAIAPAARAGDSRSPATGHSRPAATGISSTL